MKKTVKKMPKAPVVPPGYSQVSANQDAGKKKNK